MVIDILKLFMYKAKKTNKYSDRNFAEDSIKPHV